MHQLKCTVLCSRLVDKYLKQLVKLFCNTNPPRGINIYPLCPHYSIFYNYCDSLIGEKRIKNMNGTQKIKIFKYKRFAQDYI